MVEFDKLGFELVYCNEITGSKLVAFYQEALGKNILNFI